jgi:hypothetical protein
MIKHKYRQYVWSIPTIVVGVFALSTAPALATIDCSGGQQDNSHYTKDTNWDNQDKQSHHSDCNNQNMKDNQQQPEYQKPYLSDSDVIPQSHPRIVNEHEKKPCDKKKKEVSHEETYTKVDTKTSYQKNYEHKKPCDKKVYIHHLRHVNKPCPCDKTTPPPVPPPITPPAPVTPPPSPTGTPPSVPPPLYTGKGAGEPAKTFTPTAQNQPTTLPNTGAGNSIVPAFLGVSALGYAGRFIYLRSRKAFQR